MKIAITSVNDNLDSELDPRFGRAQKFIIFDTEKETFESIDNSNINASGGAGSSSAKTIADKNVEIVISGNFGPNAVMALKAFGIKMYTSQVEKISAVIERLKNGNLKEVIDATVEGKHG